LNRIFGLFVQGGRTAGHPAGGLGIGLALVRMLVEMHGGSIRASSAGPGQGSEFLVRLPLIPAPASLKPKASGKSRPLANHRILIVDDNIDAAESLAELLRAYGASVDLAHTGREAVPKAQSFMPELILLDIGLPDVDGYEVARRVRGALAEATPLIIALTGYGHEEARARSAGELLDGHLVKPIDAWAAIDFIVSKFRSSSLSSKDIPQQETSRL
jgi:CheY-like chemotaxis protein